jgi:hypothetical protein
MALDLNQSWSDASSKVSSLKTVKDTKETESKLKKQNLTSAKDKKTTDSKKQLSDVKNNNQDKIKQIKSETKNQLESLLELFKESLPRTGNSQSMSTISSFFILAANELKGQIGNILTDSIISTIGCSEEQSYESVLNQPIYIKVSQVDLFSLLKISPDDEVGKFMYESSDTPNGTIPYSMNRQLYKRLQALNQSFSQDPTAGNGQSYKGASQQELFDIEYVQNYLNTQNQLVTGDFYKITLKPQLNNRTKISDFLRDYYTSIDIMDFDNLLANLKNILTGAFSFGIGFPTDETTKQNTFFLIIKRLMGICSDPTKKIDVAGTAKLSDLDNIDDSFFEVTPQEEILAQRLADNIKNGVVEFEDCGNVLIPINLAYEKKNQQDIINEVKSSKKVDLFKKYVDDIANDAKYKTLGLEIKASIDFSIITKIPMIIVKTILTPKVLLGFLVMLKAGGGLLGQTLDTLYDDIQGFLKTFKKFVLDFTRKIFALFVEKLFEIVKANIKILVESILLEIVKESKIKQLRMYSTIIYILLIVGQAVIDYRNCKSVIDEILKLLNLALSNANLTLPPFILASSSVLGGVSDIRSMTNVIENLQKAGLPTGAAPDGGPNLMNIAMQSMIQGQNKEQAENGKTQVFIPPLTVTPAGVTLPTIGNGKSM